MKLDSWGEGRGPDDHDAAELDATDEADRLFDAIADLPTEGTCHHCGATEGQPCSPDCVARLMYEDKPTPTRVERVRDLARRAQEAQDRLGWAEPLNHQEVTYAAVDLARVVTEVARELRTLVTELDTQRETS